MGSDERVVPTGSQWFENQSEPVTTASGSPPYRGTSPVDWSGSTPVVGDRVKSRTGTSRVRDEVNVWRDVDLRPAPPGWRAVYLTEDGCGTRSLAGWLVQERTEDESADPVRRIVAARVDDVTVAPVEDDPDFWHVLTPEDRVPTWEEAMAEHARRLRLARGATVPAGEWQGDDDDDE